MDETTTRDLYPPSFQTALGMAVSLVRLRDHGRKITKAELGNVEPMLGRLVVEHQGRSNQTTYRSSAVLYPLAPNTMGQVCNPLFDHVLEKLDAKGAILSGYEISTENGVTTQYVQVWWVRPLTAV
jgi:hypothetical protein